ncbi:hypothetical protein K0M31_012619, partial [Melipona bicolor]
MATTTYVEAKRYFYIYPEYILQKIKWKRKLKYTWQKQRTKINKEKLNAAVKESNNTSTDILKELSGNLDDANIQDILSRKIKEVKKLINETQNSKAPGVDLINGSILKQLPPKAVRLLTIIFNAILRIKHFPINWKIVQV